VESEKWLERAIYCFEQVNDIALASKARTHRSSIRFRLALLQGEEDDCDVVQAEVEAALLTEKLLAEQLFLEAREVCCAILPLLGLETQEKLQRHLIALLPSVEEHCM